MAGPIVFGEVLFDCFPDGSEKLGGAPFNVAWHLQGLGASPLFLTAVGDDPKGREVLDRMRSWGMQTEGVQVSKIYPTGIAEISLQDGEPQFDLKPERAYDHIAGKFTPIAPGHYQLIYHGTLALRGEESKEALNVLRTTTGLPTFVDLNLRAPWWNDEVLQEILIDTSWLKLNEHELSQLSKTPDSEPGNTTLAHNARIVCEKYQLQQLVVTRGAEGALVATKTGELLDRPALESTTPIVDTVGAGDAFSAIWIFGILNRWSPELTIERALRFSSFVCTIQGALIDDENVYREYLTSWQQK